MSLRVSVVSVERELLATDEAEAVVAPGAEGVMTVLPGHEPIIATLRGGRLVVVLPDRREEITIGGGCLGVQRDEVVVMVDAFAEHYERCLERAVRARDRAREAQAAATSEAAVRRALRDLDRATTRLAIAKRQHPALRPGRRKRLSGDGLD